MHCTLDVCANEICNSNRLAGAGVNISSGKRWEEFRTFDNVLPVFVVMAIISALMRHVPLYLPNHGCGSVQRNVSTTENDRFYVGTIIHD